MTSDTRPASVVLDAVGFAYGGTQTVRDVSLLVPPGTLLVLVGPSGSGKSTLLRLVAGLLAPHTGRILIGDEDVTNVPTERRLVGLVPQSYALFEHLNVAENVAFGLRMRGMRGAAQQARVNELLELCHIEDFAHRSVRALSGGQRQRVAIARALAVRPRVLLLDEPLAALDPQLRGELRTRLEALVRASGVTTLFVTHDQAEALAVADQIAVLRAGYLEQVGTPQQLWQTPANAFVARFVGAADIVTARRVAAQVLEIAPGLRVNVAAPVYSATVLLALRPTDLVWGQGEAAAVVVNSTYLGDRYQLQVELQHGLALTCYSDIRARVGERGIVGLRLDAQPPMVKE